MRKIFIMNGSGGVGKDTFIEMVEEVLSTDVYNISSVTKVKEAAYILGWDGKKDEKGRQFLSDLKDMSGEVYDGPFRYMEDFLLRNDDTHIFFHIREPLEIKRFVDKYPEIKTILMKRDTGEKFSNHADAGVSNYDYDIIINNDGTLDDLNKKAKTFVERYINESV